MLFGFLVIMSRFSSELGSLLWLVLLKEIGGSSGENGKSDEGG